MKALQRVKGELLGETKDCKTFDDIINKVARYILINYKKRAEPLQLGKKRKK